MLKYSKHAQRRSRQRAMDRELVEFAIESGRESRSHGDFLYLVDDRILRGSPLESRADRCRGLCVVVTDNDTIRTLKWHYRLRRRPGVLRRRRVEASAMSWKDYQLFGIAE